MHKYLKTAVFSMAFSSLAVFANATNVCAFDLLDYMVSASQKGPNAAQKGSGKCAGACQKGAVQKAGHGAFQKNCGAAQKGSGNFAGACQKGAVQKFGHGATQKGCGATQKGAGYCAGACQKGATQKAGHSAHQKGGAKGSSGFSLSALFSHGHSKGKGKGTGGDVVWSDGKLSNVVDGKVEAPAPPLPSIATTNDSIFATKVEAHLPPLPSIPSNGILVSSADRTNR